MRRPHIPMDEGMKKVFFVKNGQLIKIFKSGKVKECDSIFEQEYGYKHYTVTYNGKKYISGRVAYYIQSGEDPGSFMVDHVDGNTLNNRIENLRLVDNRGNQQNRKSHRGGALIGACWDKNKRKWQSGIRWKKVKVFLGYCSSEESASLAYRTAQDILESENPDLGTKEARADLRSRIKNIIGG